MANEKLSQQPITSGLTNSNTYLPVIDDVSGAPANANATPRLLREFMAALVALPDAATIATDASLSNYFRVTLGGNRTLGNPTNPVDGQRISWELIQDGVGNRTLTLDTAFALGTDIAAVTLSTAANKRDFLVVTYNLTSNKFYVVGFVRGY